MNLLDLLFPKSCLECKKPGSYICQSCIQKVEKASSICINCKRFSARGITHPSCQRETSLNRFTCAYKYQGIVCSSITAMKYHFARSIAQELAQHFINAVSKTELADNSLIVPIPLHTKRQNWRGFNQAELLGKEIAKIYSCELNSDILRRTMNNPQQARLSKSERMRNTCGIFAVNIKAIQNILDINKKTQPIIVVFDDVCTTGSTLNEAAKVLKKMGVKEVWGMSIAR